MRKVYFFLILFLCMGLTIKAQDITVSGYVTSSEDGYGLPGVTIQVKGTSNGTITEIDGDYTISANSRDTLVFSYVGYQTQNIAVDGRNRIDVVMSTDAMMLDNVVVTALGIKRQKRELGYATEDISGEDLTRSGSDNVINSLSGRAAGVQAEIEFALARAEEASILVDQQAAGLLPTRVTHNDTKLNNVMFRASDRTPLCVMDLDTTMPGLSAYDFGDAVRFGASTAAEDEKDVSKMSMDLHLFQVYTQGFLTFGELAGPAV